MDRAYRTVHTVKGGADFFDLVKIHELAGHVEDMLALIRSRGIVVTTPRISALLAAADRLRELIQNAPTSNQADNSGVVAALNSAITAAGPGGGVKRERRVAPHLRVLVVEDYFTSRLLLHTFLSRYGECHIAVNGREAMEAFGAAAERGQRYVLICMDILMPELDGRETVRRMRTLEEAGGILSTHGAKIVMTTTVAEIGEVIQCFRELEAGREGREAIGVPNLAAADQAPRDGRSHIGGRHGHEDQHEEYGPGQGIHHRSDEGGFPGRHSLARAARVQPPNLPITAAARTRLRNSQSCPPAMLPMSVRSAHHRLSQALKA